MPLPIPALLRRITVTALMASAAAGCAVVPAEPGYYYRPTPTVIETYPAYRYYGPPPAVYYEQRYYDNRRHGDDGEHRHREQLQPFERRLVSPPNPVGDALRLRRDVNRKLGLPF